MYNIYIVSQLKGFPYQRKVLSPLYFMLTKLPTIINIRFQCKAMCNETSSDKLSHKVTAKKFFDEQNRKFRSKMSSNILIVTEITEKARLDCSHYFLCSFLYTYLISLQVGINMVGCRSTFNRSVCRKILPEISSQ